MLTDITEFSIPAGKIYLSSIIDCFDGMVPTWRIGTSPNAELVNEMLDEYHDYLKEETPLIHSDRGVHYRWPGWIKRMKEYGFTRSMSRKGFSCDNAACEGFFGHLKTEMFYGKSWLKVSIEEFIKILNEYIIWYNTKRIKQTLNYMSLMNTDKAGFIIIVQEFVRRPLSNLLTLALLCKSFRYAGENIQCC